MVEQHSDSLQGSKWMLDHMTMSVYLLREAKEGTNVSSCFSPYSFKGIFWINFALKQVQSLKHRPNLNLWSTEHYRNRKFFSGDMWNTIFFLHILSNKLFFFLLEAKPIIFFGKNPSPPPPDIKWSLPKSMSHYIA